MESVDKLANPDGQFFSYKIDEKTYRMYLSPSSSNPSQDSYFVGHDFVLFEEKSDEKALAFK